MKTPMLRLLVVASFLWSPLTAAEKTDAELAREAEIAVAKAKAERVMAAEKRVAAELAEKKLRESGIAATVIVFQVMPGRGYLARPTGVGFTGPEKFVQIQDTETVRGTGLDSHKMVDRPTVERRYVRQEVHLPQLFFVQAPTAGLVDKMAVKVLIWPTGPYHYTAVTNGGSTVAGYTTTPPAQLAAGK